MKVNRPITVQETTWEHSATNLSAVRTAVFVKEQNVPLDLELDDYDPLCVHYLALDSKGIPIGTARLTPSGQIGRMAVLPPFRRHGVGALLLQAAIEGAVQRNYQRIFLHAQTHAIGFYAKFGFVANGDEFDDAGIPHKEMIFSVPDTK